MRGRGLEFAARATGSQGMRQQSSNLNIFRSILTTTKRTEPFHSQFLADALNVSLGEGRELFDGFWKLAAPAGWNPPGNPKVTSELFLEDGRRIDLCIICEEEGLVLGIEVKTAIASAREGQLEDYATRLRSKYGDKRYKIAMTYLTPFNHARAKAHPNELPSVEAFRKFSKKMSNSDAKSKIECRHISWLDVAEIDWDGCELWKQHQSYVRAEMASEENLGTLSRRGERDREFAAFFEDGAAESFALWRSKVGEISEKGVTRIDLASGNLSPVDLVEGLKILITSESPVDGTKRRDDEFSQKLGRDLRKPFEDSDFGRYHRALFDLSDQHQHVWLKGEKDYGMRVAHERHPGGVSLITSVGHRYLKIGQSR